MSNSCEKQSRSADEPKIHKNQKQAIIETRWSPERATSDTPSAYLPGDSAGLTRVCLLIKTTTRENLHQMGVLVPNTEVNSAGILLAQTMSKRNQFVHNERDIVKLPRNVVVRCGSKIRSIEVERLIENNDTAGGDDGVENHEQVLTMHYRTKWSE